MVVWVNYSAGFQGVTEPCCTMADGIVNYVVCSFDEEYCCAVTADYGNWEPDIVGLIFYVYNCGSQCWRTNKQVTDGKSSSPDVVGMLT